MKTVAFGVSTIAFLAIVPPVHAQQTTLYAYDALGRLTNSGENDTTTRYYVRDRAGNRASVRCSDTVGGWQVKDDGFDPYFYLQTYADIRAADVDRSTLDRLRRIRGALAQQIFQHKLVSIDLRNSGRRQSTDGVSHHVMAIRPQSIAGLFNHGIPHDLSRYRIDRSAAALSEMGVRRGA